MILNSPIISGSLTVTGNIITSGSITISGSIASASYASNADLLDGLDSTVFTLTSSFNAQTASFTAFTASLNAFSASINTATSSFSGRVGALESYTASLNLKTASFATTGSNNFTSTQHIADTTNPTGFDTTASLYSEGGLGIKKDTYISSSLYIKGNLTVYGTQSVSYITSSQLNISTNIITVNTSTPSIRFGGLAVQDSGSVNGLTGSLLWDSQNNSWLYNNPSGSGNYDSSLVIMGPRNSSALGNEVGLSCNYLVQGHGHHHTTSSGIFHDGSTTCIPNALIGSIACFANSVTVGNASGGTMLQVGNASAGLFTTPTAIQMDNSYGNINSPTGLKIYLYKNGTETYGFGLNSSGTVEYQSAGNHAFYTTVGGTATEKMRITASGSVGICNNNPLKYLHIGPGSDSPINPNNGLYVTNNGTTAIILRDGTNDVEYTEQVSSTGAIIGTLTNHDLLIYTCNAERGRICANGKTRFLACGFGSYIFGNPNVSDDGTFIIGSVVGGTPLSLTDGYNAHTYFKFCSGQSVIESDGTMKFMTAGSTNSLILAGTTGIACFSTTNAMIPPVGTTAQRPTASTGMMRYNSTFNLMEFYNGTSWVQMGSGDLATAQCINNTSMCHSVYQASGTLGLQGQGSGCISLYGAAAPSMAISNTGNQFATHGGHCGASDYPGYWAVHLGGARAVNQLKAWIHSNSWGYFELQGSNNSGNASGFNQSGNWTTLSFLCSNNSNCQNMGGNASGCTDGTVFNFWYTNDVPFAAYRIKVLDSSRYNQPIGSIYGGSAGYVWQLNRV